MAYAAECRVRAIESQLNEKRNQKFCGYDVDDDIISLERDLNSALSDLEYYKRKEKEEAERDLERERERGGSGDSSNGDCRLA